MKFAALPVTVFTVLLAVPATVRAQQGSSDAPPSLTALRVDDSAIGDRRKARGGAVALKPPSRTASHNAIPRTVPRRRNGRRCGCCCQTPRSTSVSVPSTPIPGAIVARLARRDRFPQSDHISIYFDSFHDRRTAFQFAVGPSGSIRDRYSTNDRRGGDFSWDPVWQVATSIDELGWVAEFRIPLTQLRFATDQATWGFQVRRYIPAEERTSVLGAMVQSIQRVRVAFR